MAIKKAILAAGCFWGVEYKFSILDGVSSVISGYTGGKRMFPSYQEVCTGQTGHAEAVEILYDDDKLQFDDLLTTFFEMHDPTTLNRQGPDIGTQYRSAIFYCDDEQKNKAEEKIKNLNESGEYARPIATTLEKFDQFFPAEEYHQKYYIKNGIRGCGI